MKTRAGTAALVIAAALGSCFCESRGGGSQSAFCLVTTINGDVQGVDLGSSCAFLGIPFAAPPVGRLRWTPPQPVARWAPATLSATLAPPSCPLIDPPGTGGTTGSEDCLKLNIWTPHSSSASLAPVIVWIHDGGFIDGSANLAAHDGRHLAEQTGAVIVAANYRVGPFGFLGHAALTAEDPAYASSGNYGLLDQRAALTWVRDHIAAFGGNPTNVTIAGQSVGADSVSLHVVSPGSAGYFSRAIMQSGYALFRWRTLAEAESLGANFASALGCTSRSQVLACMRSKTLDEVLLALPSGQRQFAETARAPWGPVVDGLEIPDQPRALYESGAFTRVPVIVGTVRDEGWTYVDRSFPAGLTAEVYQAALETEFGTADTPAILATYPPRDSPSPKHALARLTSDVEYLCEARRVARLIERTGTPVYLYSFEYEADPVVRDLVVHGLDTHFVFGNNFGPPTNYTLNEADAALAGAISGYWTRFAATGDPNIGRKEGQQTGRDRLPADDHDAVGVTRWPAFEHSAGRGQRSDAYIVFNHEIRLGQLLRERQCNFWEPFFLRSVVSGSVPASQP